MTLNEFKAFIEGMDIKTAPTQEQWARICGKLSLIESEVRTDTIKIIEKEVLPIVPSWPLYPTTPWPLSPTFCKYEGAICSTDNFVGETMRVDFNNSMEVNHGFNSQ